VIVFVFWKEQKPTLFFETKTITMVTWMLVVTMLVVTMTYMLEGAETYFVKRGNDNDEDDEETDYEG
jgi:uncharacterized membrane protein